jgi:hypothetical protein
VGDVRRWEDVGIARKMEDGKEGRKGGAMEKVII